MNKFFIRKIDIILSATSIIFLSPLFFIIILILKFTGEKKIFFKQARIGKNLEKFNIIKFATMKENSPFIGSKTITIPNDPRVLPFGKFLRSSKLNELPQLINILNGEMSFIGYRPLVEKDMETYSQKDKIMITKQLPGLSGLSSLFFFNEESLFIDQDPRSVYSKKIAPVKLKLDLWYSYNYSLTNYLKLIFITPIILISRNKNILKFFFQITSIIESKV